MGYSMDSYITRGQMDVTDKLNEGKDQVSQIGDEFREVKDQIQDIPGGLDDDLKDMIKNAELSGRQEALADIEVVERSLIDTAKTTADSIGGDVRNKISDNTSVMGKIDGINSKYGQGDLARAKAAIDANTRKGEDLLRMLDDAIKDADQSTQRVKDKL